MKTLFSLFASFFLIFSSQAQEICIVSADYLDGEHYVVAWSKPFDPSLYDSVFVYRKKGLESVFSKVGAQPMSELSLFKDLTSSTIDSTKYKISFLEISGNETALSPWHQASILDYNAGTLWWTKYKKEDQIDQSYIYAYECIRDQTGIGAYTTMGTWDPLGATSWFDQEALGTTNSTYFIEITFTSSCYLSKANINTSRSNIKKQFPNSEASTIDLNSEFQFQLSPNPIQSQLNMQFNDKLFGSSYKIIDSQGKVVLNGNVTSPKMTLEMNEFPSGTYYISVETSEKVLSKMFVKN